MELKEIIEGLKEAGLITDQGVLVSGNGILCKNTKRMIELLDRNNFLLAMIEKKIEANTEKLDKLIEKK